MPVSLCPVLPLLDRPDAAALCVSEALFGEALSVLSVRGRWRYVQTPDGYTGWPDAALLPGAGQTVPVTARFCAVHPTEDFRRPPIRVLPRGARVTPAERRDGRVRLEGLGWTRASVLEPLPPLPLGERLVLAARGYLDTPYRWGGRSPLGIDCSGLCQMAAALCGVSLWRDARPLKSVRPLGPEPPEPGDLVYFPGHMALWTGADRILHASASRGCVLEEPLSARPDLAPHAEFYRIDRGSPA